MTAALIENVSVKLNTTVYANVVFNKKTFAQSKPIHFSMLIREKLEKKNGTKTNQRTFRIDKNVRLIAS